MKADRISRLALLSPALASLATAAPAQDGSAPFLDWTVEESRAFGLEMIASRLTLADHFAPPFDEELVEQLEAAAGPLLARFGGTLAERDAQLAEELAAALAEMAEAAEEGEDPSAAAAEAASLLARAREVVLDQEVREAPAFKAAVLVDLLLAEGGVAEGYEEAVEEVWEYPSGWTTLQRVDLLWAEIQSLATEEHRGDAEEMLAALHALYPDAGPPGSVVGWNPEEAEAPAQRLAGIVESVVGADLFPGRDFARLAAHLAETTGASCAAYEVGDDAIGVEAIIAVHDLYEGELAATAGLFAPEAHAEAQELFPTLAELGEDDDDEGEEEGEDDEAEDGEQTEESDTAPADPSAHAAACAALSETLSDIGSALGG
ncbi:hypothetical protein [Roseitranquillus sediminis]|uniref:hypothetical protein n=1 Tax=Roseitranquillus sediminis TaxID=2809051 RepID=UPI001D0C6F8B|nr:hypothetical protein [Roseitranquillus sediminis]MBM9595469.1 hypothetical protein [Roseitranquillus sediminis]